MKDLSFQNPNHNSSVHYKRRIFFGLDFVRKNPSYRESKYYFPCCLPSHSSPFIHIMLSIAAIKSNPKPADHIKSIKYVSLTHLVIDKMKVNEWIDHDHTTTKKIKSLKTESTIFFSCCTLVLLYFWCVTFLNKKREINWIWPHFIQSSKSLQWTERMHCAQSTHSSNTNQMLLALRRCSYKV